MTERLDRFVADLQSEMDERVRDEFGPEVYARWQNPPFKGRLGRPTCSGFVQGSCGDAVVIDLEVRDGRIVDAGFWTDGCGSSVVSCSACCELAMGRTLGEAADIGGRAVLDKLGDLPPENRHCARLASKALEDAVRSLAERG